MKWYHTPYGFKEMEYKGFTITDSDGTYYPKGITVEIYGDICPAKNLKEAKEKIDKVIKQQED